MVAGLDHGWLWQALYDLPCHTPGTPGHRPPLYFLVRDIERLWLLMHWHDWSKLLADARVQLFIGEDAADQCRRSMIENPQIPWPKLSVTVDPQIWPAGVSVDSIWSSAHQSANQQMQDVCRKVEPIYGNIGTKNLARRLRGEGLRVMGITSLYTTFLKYSMSDWLDAFTEMGHEALACIERADHEINNPLTFAKVAAEFQPDLILMIDHYRAEIPGLPQQIPCVMWVQDNLPNIFTARAGAAQGLRDYCLGFGRLHLRDQFGYPEQRFLPAHVSVNESRFAPIHLDSQDRETYGCDVSFVSHASTPPTVMLTEQLQRADATGRKLLIDIYEQMRAVYDRGQAITHASIINKMIQESLFRLRFNVDATVTRQLSDFFIQRINNALFRHQSLTWAAELDLKVHLWGRGWEQHPKLGRFAKGVACNQSQLLKIYQASKINLQITPFGAVHQRLLDGLAAGGFFLVRQCAGDLADRVHLKLWNWCNANGIATHQQFLDSMDADVQQWLLEYKRFMGVGLLDFASDVIAHLRLSADCGFTRSAGTVWPEYDRINFDSKDRLKELVTTYLPDESARKQIADSMRQVVLDRFTYQATTRRLLELIADDLAGHPSVREAAA
ncbi:MAG TPA: glycosyltransferase [Tepidisphaeraceae bacterium]|nr:glycosyltransferase [Tepidisphaeraceae bacterium]